MVKSENFKDLKHAQNLLDKLKLEIKQMEEIWGEDSIEFEDYCENVTFQLCEIDEFILGEELISPKTLMYANVRMMTYWRYLQENMSFKELMKELRKYS
ncbi:MAG: hypothetical protein E6370_16520 [Clostridiales bacterium]|jgi:hypothetical protein|nr:hypothetical protein [Clostridiales bacterium]